VRRFLDWYRNAGLRTKFTLHIIFSTSVVFAILLPLVLYIQKQVLLGEVQESGYRLAKVFAHSSVQAVVSDDYLVLQHIAYGISSQRRIVHAMLLTEDGRVLVHNDPNERGGRYEDAISRLAARTQEPLLQRYETPDGMHIYDFAVPVYFLNQKRASARIGISIDHELGEIARTRNYILALGFGILGLGLAWAMYQARRVTRPVQTLVQGTQEIAGGNLDHRITVESGDELGQLALAFNRMTGDLHESHQQLVVAQTELVYKTRLAAMGEIAAAVAHETRNPLGALSNCVQLLRMNPHLTGEDAEVLDIIQMETRRLNAIVSDFLAFGRPRPAHFQEVDLHELIDETFALLLRDDRCSTFIVFLRQFDPFLEKVTADRDQLRQVFWNLFQNAVQVMGEEGELGVETRRDGDHAQIVIRDSGAGIPTTVLPNIFEPFYTTKSGGTGLGLAIVRRIVEEHGGQIAVDSQQGVGTCFVLNLPLDRGSK